MISDSDREEMGVLVTRIINVVSPIADTQEKTMFAMAMLMSDDKVDAVREVRDVLVETLKECIKKLEAPITIKERLEYHSNHDKAEKITRLLKELGDEEG